MNLRLLATLILAASACLAQSITGSISGVVTDSSGASIPGANIIILNLDANLRTTVTTDSSGAYTAPNRAASA